MKTPGSLVKNRAHQTLDAEAVQLVAQLLGLMPDASSKPVEVKAEVVDVTEGVIGGEDVTVVKAQLDLATGQLTLTDTQLGHPLLVWDEGEATIHLNERHHSIPVVEHSVPEGLWRTEIADHIKNHGYRALLDLRALLTQSTDSGASEK